MIPRPNRPDPARLIATLGIQARPLPAVDEVLAALAALKARREVLGVVTPAPFPPGTSPDERRRITLDALDALPSKPWWEHSL